MARASGYSKIQWKILCILKDGKTHTAAELQSCCAPSSVPAIRLHIMKLCSKLPVDYDIGVIRRKAVSYYVLIKFPEDGHPIVNDRPY